MKDQDISPTLDDYSLFLEKSERYRSQNQWSEALSCYQIVLQIAPTEAKIHALAGDALLNMMRWQESANAYRKSLDLDPNVDWTWHNLAIALSHLDEWDEMLQCHLNLYSLQPDFWEKNSSISMVNQHFQTSIETYKKRLALYKDQGQVDKAIKLYYFLKKIVSNDFEIYYWGGILLMSTSDFEKAIDSLKQATKLAPHFSLAWQALAENFIQSGRFSEARDCYKRIRSLSATSETSHSVQLIETGSQKVTVHDDLYNVIQSEFNIEYYLEENPDVRTSEYDAVEHYILYGWQEGRNPNSSFSTSYYLEAYHDVRNVKLNPFYHYLTTGRNEGRQPNATIRDTISPYVDTTFYSQQCGSLYGYEPVEHYIAFGWRSGFDPNPQFSVKDYLQLNADVRRANIEPLFHYLTAGQQEGRASKSKNIRTVQPRLNAPRVLFVGHSAIKAGAEVVLLDMIRWYANHTAYNLKVILLQPGILAKDYGSYAETLVLNNIEELSSPLVQEFLDEHYDYIYLNTIVSGAFTEIYEQLYLESKVPVILHVHEMEKVILEYENHFKKIKQHAVLMIAASNRVRDVLVNKFGVPKDHVVVFQSFIQTTAHNRIELSQHTLNARKELRISADEFVVIGAGTVYWRKGPDIFLNTAQKFITKFPDKPVRFIWFGDGPELDLMRRKAQELQQQEKIQFLGFKQNANILIAAGDVFFLSSREDPFPLVCLEAAQYAIPILCFEETTGITEFVGDQAGVCLPKLDIQSAVTALVKLFCSSQIRELLGCEARRLFLQSYESEARIPEIFYSIRQTLNVKPSVTAIVPNYNHEKYLPERLDSIINQSIRDIEIVILDDLSSDASREVIDQYSSRYINIEVSLNTRQSGSPFHQWRKGLELAKSDIVWIAESDDFCDLNLVEVLLQEFDDQQVVISYCKTEVVNANSELVAGALNNYIARAHPKKFMQSFKKAGYLEVEENFSSLCTIVNASSMLFRKSVVDKFILKEATNFKICGDWYIYLDMLSKGKISYSINTINYFRRHSQSTVHLLEGTEQYFQERFWITEAVIQNFYISERAFQKALVEVDIEWQRFKKKPKNKAYSELFDKISLTETYKTFNKKRKINIGFYVHGILFSKGGIERLVSDISNELVRRGHSVYIFCRIWGDKESIYDFEDSINIVPIFDENNVDETILDLRKALIQSNVEIFVPMLSEWLFEPIIEAAQGLPLKIIASEHNDPWKIEKLWWNRDKRISTFSKVDMIHLLLECFIPSLPKSLQEKVCIIPNGCKPFPQSKCIPMAQRKKRVIGVGRLVEQKRFDRLIRAFTLAVTNTDFSDWVLDIYGEGGDKDDLQKLINSLNMADKIILRGCTNTIQDEYANSSIFVIPSEFEGFGIVVVEAKMAGLPCIAYADCNGPNELIHHGVDGFLADSDLDGSSLTTPLIRLMSDATLRQKIGQQASQAAQSFDLEIVVSRWEELLVNTVEGSPEK